MLIICWTNLNRMVGLQVAHWKEHRSECSRMAQQMAKAGDLLDFPFTFTAEVTQRVRIRLLTLLSRPRQTPLASFEEPKQLGNHIMLFVSTRWMTEL